jgi:hypothetical protein
MPKLARNQNLTQTDFARSNYYFQNFENLDDLKEKGKEAVQKVVDEYAKNQMSNAFTAEWAINGNGGNFDRDFIATTRAEADKGEFFEYINKPALESTMNAFDNFLTKVDMGGAFEKAKLIITDDSRGIFDFGLASKGLYRLPEFYSEELKKTNPFEFNLKGLPGIVPPDFVRRNNLDQYWYDSIDLKQSFLLERRQKGTTNMLEINPNAKIITDDNGMIYTDPLTFDGNTLEFATTTKKSYIMFEKKGGKAKMVDLYVGVGGLGTLSFRGMLARAMPLFLCARFFESVGIKTRINATRMYKDGNKFFAITYPIKEYGQDIDFNWLAINTADPRWFRWNLWKYVSALSQTNTLGGNTRGWGNTVYGGNELFEVFNRYKNWYFQEMKEGRQPEISLDKNLMITGGLPDPSDSSLTNMNAISTEFYRILDIVDFQFNKPDKASKRIYDRMKEKNPNVSSYDVRTYITNIAQQANKYPEEGPYATPTEEANILEDKYDVILEGMNQFLATI